MKNSRKAAAIKYKANEDRAPKLVAKGKGLVADAIIEKAKKYGIHVKEDKDLIELLYSLDIYQEIPETLYKAIANILIELYQINKKI